MQFFKKLNSVNKKTKKEFIIWSIITILFVLILVSIAAWLAISYRNTFDYVEKNFANNGPLSNTIMTKDIITGKEITLGEIYNSIGQESFTWFYTTTYNKICLIPYILLPITVIIAIAASLKFGFVYFKIFPPKQKVKKIKKSKKGKK